ncbi:MAG: hybrid sensor histidine kinase/response regulator [Candidatus Kapaibacterium sp.]|nr:MAG: hybrid sensor histidine kinase/response regulator [Candidatus Kapabacteria bacterium]
MILVSPRFDAPSSPILFGYTHSQFGQIDHKHMETVLVVEDSPIVLQSIVESLRFNSFNVISAVNGLEATELAKQFLPDIIISDIMMDGMDGYGLFNELRKDPKTAIIPFLFMSAKTDFDDIRFAMNLGADDYIPKPFTPTTLITTIKTRLHKHSLMQTAVNDKIKQLTENLAYAMPHELRTPMTAIMGCSDLIKRNLDPLNVEEVMFCSEMIDTSVRRLYRLIEQFNHYAQLTLIESNPAEHKKLYKQLTSNPHEVLHEFVYEELSRYERTQDFTMEDSLGEAIVPIKPYYLDLVVRELLANAIKFSQPGTPIKLILSKTRDKWYSIALHDKGRGISRTQIRNIEAFTQFDRQQYEQQGVGLGLALVKKITQLYRGKLNVQSDSTLGTTVQILLPTEAPVFE